MVSDAIFHNSQEWKYNRSSQNALLDRFHTSNEEDYTTIARTLNTQYIQPTVVVNIELLLYVASKQTSQI